MSRARENRLKKAKVWLKTIDTEKHIVSKYSRHFKVDHICACVELRLLGFNIPDVQIENFKKEAKSKALRKQQKKWDELYGDSTPEFYSIIGYTNWGFPYGVTWEDVGLNYEEEYDKIFK